MTSFTKQRTYTPQQIAESRKAWTAGRFSDEWKPWRHLAAMEAGIIMPPSGDAYDSWDDDQPSERALLIRAIRETPDALNRAIRSPRVHSWSAVIAILVRGRDEQMTAIERRDADWEAVKDRRGRMHRASDVMTTIGDSLGVER